MVNTTSPKAGGMRNSADHHARNKQTPGGGRGRRAEAEAHERRRRGVRVPDREAADAYKVVAKGTSEGGLALADIELMSWINMFCDDNMNNRFPEVVQEIFALPCVARVELETLCTGLSGVNLVPRPHRDLLSPEQRCRVSVKLYDWGKKWNVDNVTIDVLLLPYESWKREHVL
jgi:hypothetical protein